MKEVRQLYEIDHRPPPEGKLSFNEFMAWAAEDVRAEWEDGEVLLMSPAARIHQELMGWLYIILKLYTQHHHLGVVLTPPFMVRLRVTDQGREPDLIFIRSENLERLHDTYLDGPADLLIEIVSPESISRDRGRKYVEYEAEGVAEYWLLDPLRRQAEFYQLGADGHYQQAMSHDGIYNSTSVDGFWLDARWLWQDPLPNALEILRHLHVLP